MSGPFTKRFAAAAAVVLVAASVLGQDACPRTRALHVPDSIRFNGAQNCGSISLNVGTLEVTSPGQGCPLLAIYLPQHEIEVQSNGETRTQVHARTSARVFHFHCTQEWFLFVPWGSGCAVNRVVNAGPLLRMTTVSCGD